MNMMTTCRTVVFLSVQVQVVIGVARSLEIQHQHMNTLSTAVTNSGCECESYWKYKGQSFSGVCGNPDNDIRGPWCFVDSRKPCAGACFDEPFGDIDGMKYDHCPNWGGPSDTELIPGELLGRWTGKTMDVANVNVDTVTVEASDVDMDLCAAAGSPRLKLTDESGTAEVHIVKQVICTGHHRGVFYSEIEGQTRCNTFRLNATSRTLRLQSHLEAKPYDCSPLDDDRQDSTRRIVDLVAVDGQVSDTSLLCQPRLPPPELIGKWEGIKTVQMSDAYDNMIAKCAVSVTATTTSPTNPTNTIGLMIRSEQCTNAMVNNEHGLEQQRTDIIFDAHIGHCQTEATTKKDKANADAISKGTLLAYTADGREICYRYVRSTDGSLRMAYQVMKQLQKNHHACPEEVKVSRDVAELSLSLTSDGVSQFDWLCKNSTGRLSLVPNEVWTNPDVFNGTKEQNWNNVGVILGASFVVLLFCALFALSLHGAKKAYDKKRAEIIDNGAEIIDSERDNTREIN